MLIAFKDRKTSEAVITVADTGVEIPENIKDNCSLQCSLQVDWQGFGLTMIKHVSEALE